YEAPLRGMIRLFEGELSELRADVASAAGGAGGDADAASAAGGAGGDADAASAAGGADGAGGGPSGDAGIAPACC
ncbi:hypothetical protein ACTHPH_24440, partial [Paenibacillus pasadenensis]|uniref:hypothetical protein n=1 Tax=Paenibacillus pasadenensis TaxID=217090 RepID=UPI003F7FA197